MPEGNKSSGCRISSWSIFPSFSIKGTALLVPFLLFLAFVLRSLALIALKKSIYFDFLLWDERVYQTWATQIANGIYTPSAVYEFAPLPAYLLACIYWILSPDVIYFRIFNILVGVGACYFVYLIGSEMGNRVTGIVACLTAALYKPFIFYSIVPLTASLSVFSFALTTYLLFVVIRQSSLVNLCLLGITTGLALNIRGNFNFFLPLTLVMLPWVRYRNRRSLKGLGPGLVLYVFGLALTTVPFVVRNYRVTGHFVLFPSQVGFNLYLGNNLENPDPYYRPVSFASPSPFEQGVQFTIEASRRVGRRLAPQEASSYWTQEVLRMAWEQPEAFLSKLLQKALVLCNRFEAGDHYDIGFMSGFIPFFRFPFVSLAFILPLAMAGIATTTFESRTALCACLICVCYALTLIIFFTNARYQLPLLVVLIPFAISGSQRVYCYITNCQIDKAALYLAVTILFVVIEFLPVQATDDMTAYYNTHAIILNSKGNEEEAIRYWGQSSQMNKPFSAFANLSLAGKYTAKGDLAKALFYLQKIPDRSFAVAYKWDLVGDILLRQGQLSEAIAAYERSLEINSGRREVRRKLIKIFRNIDQQRALQEEEKLRYISSFYKGF